MKTDCSRVDFGFHTLREGLGSEPLVKRRILVLVMVCCGVWSVSLGFHVLRGLGSGSWYTYLGVGAH